ncbi:MAG: hypothetical protein K9L68_02480 [Spirochaetales bacterium]|nr:hypothetical protein [Spirochaetales bacterium]MCF7937443.1 hypothetical protein [Spirochaetales bacterium]
MMFSCAGMSTSPEEDTEQPKAAASNTEAPAVSGDESAGRKTDSEQPIGQKAEFPKIIASPSAETVQEDEPVNLPAPELPIIPNSPEKEPAEELPAPRQQQAAQSAQSPQATQPAARGAQAAQPEPAAQSEPAAEATQAPQATQPAPQATQPEPAAEAAQTPQPAQSPSKLDQLVTEQPGFDITIRLEGSGWIYLGAPDGEEEPELVERNVSDNQTRFVLKGLPEGEYPVLFLRQDPLEGGAQRRRIRIDVDSKEAEASDNIAENTDDSETPDGSKEGAEAQSETGGIAAYEQGGYELQSEVPGTEESLREIGSELIHWNGDPGRLPDFPIDQYLGYIERLEEQGRIAEAIGLAEALSQWEQASPKRGLVYFTLGSLYEIEGPTRDLRRALAAYKSVGRGYPPSQLWEAADRRARYLERQYFNIR